MPKAVTLKMIADKVGVSKSTVSDVLRSRQGKVQVSQTTKERIFEVVRSLNYEPNAAARALVTGRTHNIGFLLSSRTTLGLANNYFASVMTGVQKACGNRGYNCLVSCYDLSSVKSFVMPSKLKRRNVDGLVISGHIEDEVLQTFVDSNLPFVLLGESTDFSLDGILCVARSMAEDWLAIFEHLFELGHRHIGVGGTNTLRGQQQLAQATSEFAKSHPGANMNFETFSDMGHTEDSFQMGSEQAKQWIASSSRPTAMVSHDQWCVGFMAGIVDGGFRCPDDVSVVSSCDTVLCRWGRPDITAISLPLYESGLSVTELLVDYIEKKITWMEANRQAARIWEKRELIVRGSTAPRASG